MADDQQSPDQPRGPADGRDATGADETRQMPADRGDETREMLRGEETSVRPASGPPQGGDTAVQPRAASWSGRAGVPPPEAFAVREAVPVDEEPDRRPWLLPMVLAILALLLLAILGIGLWLILRADDSPGPATPVTPAVTTSATPAAPSPTTPGTPSLVTTAPASPTAAAQVVVPRLIGVDTEAAQSTLEQLGLAYRLIPRADPVARPGTVLETDPAEGSVVPVGTQVVLVVAAAPPSPAPTSPALPSPVRPSLSPSR
jgi:hypothetical protein